MSSRKQLSEQAFTGWSSPIPWATRGRHGAETRQESKERPRPAILDAALDLVEEEGLAALSLRKLTKVVGIVPMAFYRHFSSIDELGLALVDRWFASLRQMIREARPALGTPWHPVPRSGTLVTRYLSTEPGSWGR